MVFVCPRCFESAWAQKRANPTWLVGRPLGRHVALKGDLQSDLQGHDPFPDESLVPVSPKKALYCLSLRLISR